jgi:DNA-binding response OmpR family regulator
MRIIVASANVFRRELSSYILSEAGYNVSEARTKAALFAALRDQQPALIVLDCQLDDPEPGLILRVLRSLTTCPLLWIAESDHAAPLLLVDERPADYITWPYQAERLLGGIACLLGRAGAARSVASAIQPFVGPAE